MANDTPESDFSIECFQNYSAPEVFIQGLAGMVNQTDIETMIRAQKQMLQRFEKTNEMLTNCNALSASRLKVAGKEFKKHTQLLLDMKKDLDYIFKKIRQLKTKLSTQYPEAFEIAQKAATAKNALEEEEDEFDTSSSKPSTSLNKDASKSTETLKPSVSQVFNKSPSEAESKELAEESLSQKESLENENNSVIDLNESNHEPVSESDGLNTDKTVSGDAVQYDKKPDTLKTCKNQINRNSNGSSSSDNSSNNYSVSSGDNTSDTG